MHRFQEIVEAGHSARHLPVNLRYFSDLSAELIIVG
jgi:hypothetical protein